MSDRTDYDAITRQYIHYTAHSPTRRLELRTLLDLAGNVEGATVLDLACGEGTFGRAMLRHGASAAHGVDLSAALVRTARDISTQQGDAMQFTVGDVLDLRAAEAPYDIVVAVWLFNYARSAGELEAMLARVHAQLRPGGRLVAYTMCPDYRLARGNYSAYGASILAEAPWHDATVMTMAFPGEPPGKFTVYRWERHHYAAAVKAAGLDELRWQTPMLTGEDIAAQPAGFWDDYIRNCPHVAFTCVRPMQA